MKKSFLISGIAAALLLISGCANASSGSDSGKSNKIPNNYNVKFEQVLSSSAEFTQKSIKALVPSRAAIEPTEEDKWEGRIQYANGTGNWNVPSYYYGLKAGDSLVVNGEDLGSLQELYHTKDERGNYRKASFIYKDTVYYVFDKADYEPQSSYIVLGTADNLNSIIFDQKGKTASPEFSNFKFWVWERDLNNEIYRRGDLGYAYTLRNVEMKDGSYATITVAGYNYYNYGFRVWIKETDGNQQKITYPDDSTYSFTSKYKVGLMKEVTSGEDFIYEIVNKTSGKLIVQNYMRDYYCWDEDTNLVAESKEVEIPAGKSYQFKYKLSELKALCPLGTDYVYMGCYFFPEGKWQCSGWENDLNRTGKKHTVTVSDSTNSCMDGDNSWDEIQ